MAVQRLRKHCGIVRKEIAAHEAAHALVRSAHFLSGVQKFPSEEAPFRAERLYFYHAYYEADEMPALIVDVTDHFAVKREALQAYRSQFWNPDYDGAETLVSSERFWHNIEHRAARLGARIGATYGEAVFSLDPVGVQILPGL